LRIHTFSLAQIDPPEEKTLRFFKKVMLPSYEMNQNNLFQAFRSEANVRLFHYNDSQWYAGLHMVSGSFNEVKYGRQTFRPPYKDNALPELSFVEMLDKNGWKSANPHYDKAFCHVAIEVDDLANLPHVLQSRLAHADGDDDPQVAHSLHYLESELDGKRTRFISGWESHSFATITESTDYFNNILMPVTSWLYLLYYVHFIQRKGIIPSDQMMPRLLGNLWASTSKDFPFNDKLIRVKSIVS
jgi:hypothetical protein